MNTTMSHFEREPIHRETLDLGNTDSFVGPMARDTVFTKATSEAPFMKALHSNE